MKNYLVIGAGSAIGQAIIDGLLDEGNHIYGITRNSDLTSDDHKNYLNLDILNDELPGDFLPDHLHGYIYCPGSINLRPFKNLKPGAFRDDFEINVMGAVATLQWALPKLDEGSSVIFFSSVAVQTGMPFHSVVGVSKGAIEGLTRSLAAEYTPRLRVNCIAPSLTDTPMASRMLRTEQSVQAIRERNPMKAIGQPEDIAAMALFLLSEKARWITGQVIGIDGGMSTLKI